MLTVEMTSALSGTMQSIYILDLIKPHHNHTKLVPYPYFTGKETELWWK